MRASATGASVGGCAIPRRTQQKLQLPRSEIVNAKKPISASSTTPANISRCRSPIVVAAASSSPAKTKTAAASAKRSTKSPYTSSSPEFGAVKHVLRESDGRIVRVSVVRRRSSSSSSSSSASGSGGSGSGGDVFQVLVEVQLLHENDAPPVLAWGTYRAAPGVWKAPNPLPAGATADPATGGARTEFVIGAGGGSSSGSGSRQATATATLELPARSAPVSLAFFLDRGEEASSSLSSRSFPPRRHFAVPVGMGVGSAARQGASLAPTSAATLASAATAEGTSVNFCVTSRHAASMSLVLARLKPDDCGGEGKGDNTAATAVAEVAPGASAPVWRAASALEIALDPALHRSGDAWHVRVDGLTDLSTLAWGWRAGGELVSDAGSRFSPGQVMLDPFARAAAWARLPEGVNVAPPRPGARELDPLEEPPALLGCLGSLVMSSEDDDDEEEESRQRLGRRRRRRRDDDRTAVLEVDPRSPSSIASSPLVPEEHRGKLFGIIDAIDASPPALFGGDAAEGRIGITAVLLKSPVSVAVPGPLSGGGGGPVFAPVSLLAPDPALAVDGCRDLMAASRELRDFVSALHARGIDAYASLEVCFTGESENNSGGSGGGSGISDAGEAAPPPPSPAIPPPPLTGRAFSLRGLDAATYYKPGTRVLDSGAPATRALAVEAARHLHLAFGFDGVQLVNAEATAADSAGAVLDAPPLPEALAHDPVLRSRVRLFASAADERLLPRSGVRGFPHWAVWGERNWRCARDLSRLMLEGDTLASSAVATRAAGSPDLTSPAWGARCGEGGLIPGNLAAGRPRAAVLNAVVAPEFVAVNGGGGSSLEAAVSRAVPPGAALPGERDALAKALLVAGAMFRGTPLFPEAAALLQPVEGGGVFVGARFLESLLAVRSRHAAALAPREDGGSVGASGAAEEEKGDRDSIGATSSREGSDDGWESEGGSSRGGGSSSEMSLAAASVASVTSTPGPDSPPPRPTRSYDSSWDSDDEGSLRKNKAKEAAPIPAIRWHGAHAATQPDWDGARSGWGEWGASVIAWSIVHNGGGGGRTAAAAAAAPPPSPASSFNPHSHASSGIYVALNPCNGPVALTLPPPPSGSGGWSRAIDTSLAAPDDAAPAASILGAGEGEEEGVGGGAPPLLVLGSSDYELGARSALVLIAKPKKIRGGMRR